MVSEALDSQNNQFMEFMEFMVSDSSGFTGPYVCWAVYGFMDFHNNYKDCWILQRTLWNSDSREFYQNLPSDLKIGFNGNSDNFHSLNSSPKKYWRTHISSMREEIHEQLVKLDNWLSLWNIQDISIKVPKPRYPSHTNSRDKESFELFNPSQAKPSQAWGAAWGAAQARCRSAALPQWLHNHTSCTCAALQWQRSSTEGQWAAAGKLRSISLVCNTHTLHKTITLHLTAVKSSPCQRTSQGQLSIYMFSTKSIFYLINMRGQ